MDNIKEFAKEDVVTVIDSSDEGDEIKIDADDDCDVMLQEAEDVVTILGAAPQNDEVNIATQDANDTTLHEAEDVVTILGAAPQNDEVNIATQDANDTTLHEAEGVTINASSDEGDKVSNSNGAVVDNGDEDEFDVGGCLLHITRKTIKDMHQLYCRHARAVGFSVRKSTTRKSTAETGVVVEKYYVCSSAGFKQSAAEKKRANVTRTGCKASIRVKLNGEGLYEVVQHIVEHNHQLTRTEWSHLHRSERVITNEKGKAIEDMISCGMKATQSYRYMVHDAGGEQSLGHTLKDHLNFVNRLKMKAIEGGDAQTLIDILYQQDVEEEDFFFRVKLDEFGRLSNVFWRDSMMKEDYKIYGDVMIFDTTYRTNKYNLICAPFVGVNNHWKNVMFGCAFLSDEKSESFEWLFQVFTKSMGGKCPVTLFTDQDLAISNAIEKVFPQTRHRLCLWHLHQNAISRFGRLKKNNSFKEAFNKCLTGCVDERDFEICWNSMILEYELHDDSWFRRMYDLKEKWCTALSKDIFSAGILSSQRSESTNSAIGFNAKKTTTLTEFYGIFQGTLKRWRNNEKENEFQCSRSIPTSVLPLTGMLRHAAEVYTLTLFKEFESEFIKSISTECIIVRVEENIMVYDISMPSDGGCCHRVVYDCLNMLINCSCKKFEECGLLCCHSLRVFHMHSISKIPECYIVKRWTKFVKTELWGKFNKMAESSHRPKDCVPWRHQMARNYYNLILKCQDNEEARRIIEDGYNRDSLAVDALMNTLNSTGQHEVSNSSNSILDPTRSVTKGRRQRIKGHFQQKNKKKKSTDTTSSHPSKEFGSKTPNPRLF